MATTKLIIRDYKGNRNLDNSSLVFCLYTHGYSKTLLSSGIKVPITAFDSQKQQVKKSYPGHTKLNFILQSFKLKVQEIVRDIILAGETPDVNKVKQLVRCKKKKTKITTLNLFDFFEQFILSQEHLKRPNTLKSYRATLRAMREYAEHIDDLFDFEEINLDWYEGFVQYLYSYHNNSQNSVGSHIKVLKVVMNAAAEKGLHSNLAYKNPKFRTLTNASDGIYCSLEELNLIASYDFSKDPKLDNTRAIFLITAFLGTRYSDTVKLQPSSIQNGTIIIHVTKTGDKLTLPIHPIVQSIINKYLQKTNQPFPRFYKSEQPYNRALKEMARKIGGPFSKPVLKKVNRGNKQITETKPKSEYMCSHVGRRSFCTNLAKNNIPIATIQKLSGHKTLKSLQIYLRQSNEEAASMVQQFWNKQSTTPPSIPSNFIVSEPVSLN